MVTKSVLTAALMIAVTASSSLLASSAVQANNFHMRIFDANSGKKVFDDGKLDGRACAVGSVANFNPFTGRFSTVPKVKCNF